MADLKVDSRARIDDWFTWLVFVESVWNYFSKDKTFGGDDVDWLIDKIVTTFRVPGAKHWDKLGDQLELIIGFIITNREEKTWENIITLMMLIVGLVETVRGLNL
jgi:hypothetical protein